MAQVTIGPQTLGSLKAMITRFHKENENDNLLTDAANDAIEALWRNILLVSLSQFMGGPITNLSLAAGSERQTIVSILDPTVAPVLAQQAGSVLAARNIDGVYTFVTESGSETLPSPITTFLTTINNLLTCAPPAYPATGNPIGWNFYACLHDGRLAKQNAQPLGFSDTFVENADSGVADIPDNPSVPAANTTADNVFYIRILQVQNTDGTWTTWQAGDLDGLLMGRASRSIASTSSYQQYAYDVLNGNTIEIRPAAGTTLTPRYFYVVKPRRLLYNNAQLPFPNISSTEFLKMYAEAQLDLSNKEYAGYGIKSKASARILTEILEGLNTQATVKQKTITPYLQW